MSISTINAGVGRNIFLDRAVRLRAALSERNRRAREFAAIERFNDHMLSDIGLRRDGDDQRRHLVRF